MILIPGNARSTSPRRLLGSTRRRSVMAYARLPQPRVTDHCLSLAPSRISPRKVRPTRQFIILRAGLSIAIGYCMQHKPTAPYDRIGASFSQCPSARHLAGRPPDGGFMHSGKGSPRACASKPRSTCGRQQKRSEHVTQSRGLALGVLVPAWKQPGDRSSSLEAQICTVSTSRISPNHTHSGS